MAQTKAMERFSGLFDLFEAAGKQLYLVGGCVRDILMTEPPKDYDFATDALPSKTREILSGGGYKVIPLGEEFGTIATVIDGNQYEITTYRVKESYTKGSRHPVVHFGDNIEDDLSRRDLTINAMAMGRDGEVIDPYGGRRDLGDQVLRVPGGGVEKTREIFADDPLRLLRVGRFAGRLGFTPDEATTTAAQAAAHTILDVSHERWKSEFDKLLVTRFAHEGISWLAEVGVLFFCLPELWALTRFRVGFHRPFLEETQRTDPVPDYLPNSFHSSNLLLMDLPETDLQLRWVGLLHALGLPAVLQSPGADGAGGVGAIMAEAIARRFKFSNEDRESLVHLVATQQVLGDVVPENEVAVRRLALKLGSLLQPALAFALARGRFVSEVRNAPEVLVDVAARIDRIKQTLKTLVAAGPLEPILPKGLGHHISTRLGIKKGPRLGLIVDWLHDEIIEGRLANEADTEVYLQYVATELIAQDDS